MCVFSVCWCLFYDLEKVNIHEALSSVSLSVVSYISETSKEHVKFYTVTASDIRALASCVNYIDLDLHSKSNDLNHKNNKCLIISETVQAMPIKFAVKIA